VGNWGHSVYDIWNRLVAYKNGSTTLESLSYDGLDRRIVENPGTARDLYYSDQWQVLEERVGGAAKVHYVWSPVYVDALVLRDRDTGGGTLSERLWVQQDANWNVTALVNGSGSVVERYVYDPYGNMTVLTASWGSTSGSSYAWIFGHQGGRLDTVTSDYNFEHREEWPALDRWTKIDPLVFRAGDTNLYRYVGDNPANATDPSGLQDHSEYDAAYGQKVAMAYLQTTLSQAYYKAWCFNTTVDFKSAVTQAFQAYNGFVNSYNTFLNSNSQNSTTEPLVEQHVPDPNSTIMQSWDQIFPGFQGQRQTSFTQIYWLAILAMTFSWSGGKWTGEWPFSTVQEALATRSFLIRSIANARSTGNVNLAVELAKSLEALEVLILKHWPNAF
jgi:RHS repeat-associated protein